MKHPRPRSADLGGLHLATAGSGFGQGWLGHDCEFKCVFIVLILLDSSPQSFCITPRPGLGLLNF